MADQPQPDTSPAPTSPDVGANISPAPADVAGPPPGAATGDPAPAPSGRVAVEPLADGTTPTVLTAGQTHKSVSKSKSSIGSVYRRADILTTIFTFAGAMVAAGIILGLYAYFTRSEAPPAAPKVTSIDKADLDKLGAFFSGNSAGGSGQVLTISSSTLFSGRVAMSSDLKVQGGADITGPTTLTDLTVNKTTTLGVTNIRGQLIVSGPVNFQSPAQFGAGGTVNGNLSVTGNGSFGGSISANTLNVQNLTVSGTLSLAGHISVSGQNPSAAPGSEAGSGATASAEGNDASGSITVNTGTIPSNIGSPGGLLGVLTFRSPYPRTPHVVITSVGQNGAALMPYVLVTATGFTVGVVNDASSNKTYTFNYWITQ